MLQLTPPSVTSFPIPAVLSLSLLSSPCVQEGESYVKLQGTTWKPSPATKQSENMERNQETEGGKGSERVPRPGQQVGVLGVHDVGGQLAAPQRIVGKSTPVGTRSGEESSSVAQKKPRLEGQPKDRTGPQVTNTGASSTAVTAAAAIGEEEQGDIEVDGKDTDVAMLLWEKQTHALLVLLSNKKMLNVDEMRRGVENLPPEVYKKVSYYGKWARSFVNILLEKGILTDSDILHHIFGQDAREESNQHQAQGEQPTPQFNVGQLVRVKKEDFRTFWIKPHLRTPGYVHNAIGVVQAYVGEFNAPNENAFWNRAKKKQHLYRITFKQSDLWIGYPLQHSAKAKDGEKREDEVLVEVFEPWLKQATSAEYEEYVKELKKLREKLFEHHETSQQEVEEHGHSHEERQQVEEAAVKKETPSFSDEMFAAGKEVSSSNAFLFSLSSLLLSIYS